LQVCNGECNHADCDYDQGDCCGTTTDDAYPKVSVIRVNLRFSRAG
jgi:hypothetical protein